MYSLSSWRRTHYIEHSNVALEAIQFDQRLRVTIKTGSKTAVSPEQKRQKGLGFRVSMVKCAGRGLSNLPLRPLTIHTRVRGQIPPPLALHPNHNLLGLRPGPTTSFFQSPAHLDLERSGEAATTDGGGAARARGSERSAGRPPVASVCLGLCEAKVLVKGLALGLRARLGTTLSGPRFGRKA